MYLCTYIRDYAALLGLRHSLPCSVAAHPIANVPLLKVHDRGTTFNRVATRASLFESTLEAYHVWLALMQADAPLDDAWVQGCIACGALSDASSPIISAGMTPAAAAAGQQLLAAEGRPTDFARGMLRAALGEVVLRFSHAFQREVLSRLGLLHQSSSDAAPTVAFRPSLKAGAAASRGR